MADYHDNNQLWQIVVDAWDKYIAEIADIGEKSPLPLLSASIVFTEGAFEIPHRGILRTSWKTRVNQQLSNVSRHEVYSRHYLGSDTVIDHDSALIRIFAQGSYGSFYNGIDMFITFYLRTKDGSEQLDFGSKRRDLQESLNRETRKYEQVDNEGGTE